MIVISFLIGLIGGFAICSLCFAAKRASEIGDYESHKAFMEKHGFNQDNSTREMDLRTDQDSKKDKT